MHLNFWLCCRWVLHTDFYFVFPLKSLCCLYALPSHSKPIAAQHSSKSWTFLFPTKPCWLVSRVPKLPGRRGSSQKLKQVLVTARPSGKLGPTIQINSPHFHSHKMLRTLVVHDCIIWKWGTALYLQNQVQKRETEVDQECDICWKNHLWGQWAGWETENIVGRDVTAHDISYFLSYVVQQLQMCLIPALP